MAADPSKIVKRLEQLRVKRAVHETVWQDCFDLTYPIRADGFNETIQSASDAQAKRARIMDSTATDSARILASGIMSGLTPANSRWFDYDAGQESEEERAWLDESADVLWQNIHASNFDSVAFECVIDVVCAGWFAMFIEEDADEGGLKFHHWPISSVYAAASSPNGKIDIVYRPFKLTAAQALEEYGEEEEADEIEEGRSFGVSRKTAQLAKEKPDELVEFVQVIEPREDYKDGAKTAKNLPYSSCTVEIGAQKVVRESGYHEKPFIIPRWMVIPSSVYGIGPVFDALPDIKTLNELCRMELNAADIAVSGMWIAEDDGVLNPRTIKIGAKKVIVANSVDSMKALQTGSQFDVSFTIKAELQRAIRKILMADQLQPQDGPAMTATEVHVRVNMIRQLLGPVYGRLQSEYLQDLIERCFGIAFRAGVFNPPPESLLNRDFTVKYISPLARAQKLEEVSAIERLYAQAGMIAQARGSLDAMDNIDDDEAIRLAGEALGVPSKIIKDRKVVEQLRNDRAEAQQSMQQQAAMQPVLEEAGKALANKALA